MIIDETTNSGPGSVVVQFGDHFRAGDHSRSNLGIISSPKIICGPVQHPHICVNTKRAKTTIHKMESLKEFLSPKTFNKLSFVAVTFRIL